MAKLFADLIKCCIVEEKQLVVFHFATVCNVGCNHGILNLECHGCKMFAAFFVEAILLQNPKIEMKRLKCFVSI